MQASLYATVTDEYIRVHECSHRLIFAQKLFVARPQSVTQRTTAWSKDLKEKRLYPGVQKPAKKLKQASSMRKFLRALPSLHFNRLIHLPSSRLSPSTLKGEPKEENPRLHSS